MVGESAVLSHLDRLESESIRILREVVASFRNTVMLYSIGKDSTVLLHLAQKAFSPCRLPFPLLHIDTTWKFSAMLRFRDQIPDRYGVDLIIHVNQDGLEQGVTPFTHDPETYTAIMKTEALKQALNLHGFKAAIAGARRDEEKSRAKERNYILD